LTGSFRQGCVELRLPPRILSFQIRPRPRPQTAPGEQVEHDGPVGRGPVRRAPFPRNGRAEATATRLVALFRITASRAAKRNNPMSSDRENSAAPSPISPTGMPMTALPPKAVGRLRGRWIAVASRAMSPGIPENNFEGSRRRRWQGRTVDGLQRACQKGEPGRPGRSPLLTSVPAVAHSMILGRSTYALPISCCLTIISLPC
jgi:hypothetical protein